MPEEKPYIRPGLLFPPCTVHDIPSNSLLGTDCIDHRSMSEHPVKAAVELCESPSRAIDAANTVDAISLVLVAGMYGVSATAAEDNLNDHRASFFAYCAAEKLDHVTRMEFLGNRIPSGMGSGSRDEYKKNVEDYTHHRR